MAVVQAHLKGVKPYTSSYMRIPRDHQSTALLCPSPLMTSGARYSSVPTKELARASGSATSRYEVGSSELCIQVDSAQAGISGLIAKSWHCYTKQAWCWFVCIFCLHSQDRMHASTVQARPAFTVNCVCTIHLHAVNESDELAVTCSSDSAV